MPFHRLLATFGIQIVLVVVASLAIATELVILRRKRIAVDRVEIRRSIALGLTWSIVRVTGGKLAFFAAWAWTWQHVAPFHWSMRNPFTWLAYWLIGDLVYYVTHRAEHRVRALWCAHLVHHSSTEFTLATAVRQSWTEIGYKPLIAFWAPLLGFHPAMYVTFGTLSLLVGQWQHLAWVGRLRADRWFVTPSNHRVHHARNAGYIDRNFGGSLVVWDKLFGTYVAEHEEPEFGVLHLPPATSAFGRSLGGFPELVHDMRATASAREAFALAAGPPR